MKIFKERKLQLKLKHEREVLEPRQNK